MPSITIDESQLEPLKEKVVIITGGSSGIGLATVEKLLAHGAKVVMGDLNPPKAALDASTFTFQTCDVTSWASLVALFKTAVKAHGRVDHVFANAGIADPKETYVNDLPLDPSTGEPLEPSHGVLAVNLIGVMNTVRLAIHHFRSQLAAAASSTSTCSVVITASGAAFSHLANSQYTASKHGVLGFARSLRDQLKTAGLADAIRINTVAPAFTDTAIIDAAQVRSLGMIVQSAETVARSAAWLMVDESCNQCVVYSHGGEFREVEGEMVKANLLILGHGVSRPTQGGETESKAQQPADSQHGSGDTKA